MHRYFYTSLFFFAAQLVGCGGDTATSAAATTSIGSSAQTPRRADLSWQAPMTEADGQTPLTDLAGYKVYYRKAGETYGAAIDVGNITYYTLDFSARSSGTYYFVVTAYDAQGNESAFSEEASKAI